MTRFIEKTTAITPNRELQPDEYFNETDHLIYCSKCNTLLFCKLNDAPVVTLNDAITV